MLQHCGKGMTKRAETEQMVQTPRMSSAEGIKGWTSGMTGDSA
jgi:hypothetical protein